jgi:diguanylate cyclase (GGDEF)-like protein/PAS domain S-box-containing protein
MSDLLVGIRQKMFTQDRPEKAFEKAAEAIRRSEQLDTLFNSLAEIVIVYNTDGVVVRVNPLTVETLGNNPAGKNKQQLNKLYSTRFPDGRRVPEKSLPASRALRGEIVRGERYVLTISDDRQLTILASATPLYDQGELVGAASIWIDITEREQLMAQLEAEHTRSELRASLSQALLEAGLDVSKVLHTVVLRVSDLYGDACIIRLLSDDKKFLEPVAYHHTDPDVLASMRQAFSTGSDHPEEGVSGEVFLTGQAKLLEHTSSEDLLKQYSDRHREWLLKQPIYSVLVVPVRAYEKTIGTLTVICNEEGRSYTQEDRDFYQDLADRAGMAIENARLHAEIQKLATLDPLTGINNRRAFFELAHHEVVRFLRTGRPLSMMMIDIDDFKCINDAHGHATGDRVLQAVASLLKNKTRALDIIGRIGGDEFAVLLPDTDKYESMEVGYRILKGIHETTIESKTETIRVSLSLGIRQIPQYQADLDLLLEQADQAMYQAKKKGGDRIEVA